MSYMLRTKNNNWKCFQFYFFGQKFYRFCQYGNYKIFQQKNFVFKFSILIKKWQKREIKTIATFVHYNFKFISSLVL